MDLTGRSLTKETGLTAVVATRPGSFPARRIPASPGNGTVRI